MSEQPTQSRSTAIPWQISYLAAGLMWGCSFLFIKVSLQMLNPILVAFGRVTLGAIALLLMCLASRTSLPRDRSTWKHLFVLAVLLNAIPFTCFAYGETHVSSAIAGMINAVTPLTAFIAFFLVLPSERAHPKRAIGLLVGFAGVITLLGVWNGLGSGEWLGIGACVLAVCCYGISFPYSRRHLMDVPYSPLSICAGQITLGSLQLLPFALLAGHRVGHIHTSAVLSIIALGVFGSGIAYVANFDVIKRAGGTVASTTTYLTPIVAVIAGMLALNEKLVWYQPVGAVIVLIGAAITQGRLRLPNLTRIRLSSNNY